MKNTIKILYRAALSKDLRYLSQKDNMILARAQASYLFQITDALDLIEARAYGHDADWDPLGQEL